MYMFIFLCFRESLWFSYYFYTINIFCMNLFFHRLCCFFIFKVKGRFPLLLVEKVEIRLWNAVLLFSTTVYREDGGSKIRFSLISVLKNWGIQPQSLDLGGSTATNEVNRRPQHQYLLFLTSISPDFDN